MRPNFLSAACAIALIAGASTTSATAAIARPPLPSISLTTASASPRLLRTLTTMAQPADASSSAISRPMLRPAPGMTAPRPARSLSGLPLSPQSGQIDPRAEHIGREIERHLGAGGIIAAVAGVEQEFVFDVL